MKKLLFSVSALLLLNVAAYAADQIQSQTQTQTQLQLKDKTKLGEGDGKMMKNQNQNQYEHKNQYKSPPPLDGDQSGYKNAYKSGDGTVGAKANGAKKSNSTGMYKGQGGSSMGSSMKGGGGKH